MASTRTRRGTLAPLYLAGFTTAFGAHGVAAVLGIEASRLGHSLLTFGLMLALYDLAEVVLKPVFGALSDRIGVKPVIIAGLIAFAFASALPSLSPTTVTMALARLGQGAAASAFSPASSSALARLAGQGRLGSYFGRYGAWKSIGYAAGPVLGALLLTLAGIGAVYTTLVVLALIAAGWVAMGVPPLPTMQRTQYTLADLVRQTADRSFVIPALALATTTAILGAAVGYLPLLLTRAGLDPMPSAAPLAVIAVLSAAAQPLVGRIHDNAGISARAGITAALVIGTTGMLLMMWTTPAALYASAVLIGLSVGITTPLAYAHLAATTPSNRLGRTMGSAELGRELGDAGGPLLVGAIAASAGVTGGAAALALVATAAAASTALGLKRSGSAEPNVA
ncbi:hypothetical protein GCM10027414_29170 [Humibacter ginsengiterrae]